MQPAPSPVVDMLLRALSDPTRRSIYERLVGEEATVAHLTAKAGVSQPTVSQHVAVLKASGLLRDRQAGRATYYRADPARLAPLVDWVARQQRFWNEALARLDSMITEIDE